MQKVVRRQLDYTMKTGVIKFRLAQYALFEKKSQRELAAKYKSPVKVNAGWFVLCVPCPTQVNNNLQGASFDHQNTNRVHRNLGSIDPHSHSALSGI